MARTMSCAPCSPLARTISSRFDFEEDVTFERTGSCAVVEPTLVTFERTVSNVLEADGTPVDLGRTSSCAIDNLVGPTVNKKRSRSELLAENAVAENISNELVGGDDATLSTTDEEEESPLQPRCLFSPHEEGEICDDPQARFDTSKLIGPCKDMVVTNEEAMNNPSQLY